MDKLLYTVEETAGLLSVGRDKIFQLIRERELESVKLGCRRRIPAAAIERFMANLCAGTNDELAS